MISVIFSTRSENLKSFGGLSKKYFLTCESLSIGLTPFYLNIESKSTQSLIIFEKNLLCRTKLEIFWQLLLLIFRNQQIQEFSKIMNEKTNSNMITYSFDAKSFSHPNSDNKPISDHLFWLTKM